VVEIGFGGVHGRRVKSKSKSKSKKKTDFMCPLFVTASSFSLSLRVNSAR